MLEILNDQKVIKDKRCYHNSLCNNVKYSSCQINNNISPQFNSSTSRQHIIDLHGLYDIGIISNQCENLRIWELSSISVCCKSIVLSIIVSVKVGSLIAEEHWVIHSEFVVVNVNWTIVHSSTIVVDLVISTA